MARHSEIFETIRPDLARVEHKLREHDRLEYEVLTAAIEHLVTSGGKRIRPALVILSSRLFSPDLSPESISLGAAVEMLHTASLVHDDLIDGSLLRRGIPTLNATWTPAATVLTGDYLFARAADLAAQTGSLRVMRLFSNTLMIICAGELKQQFSDVETRARREDYDARIYAKTASLLELATEAAGILGQASEPQIDALRDYGRCLGMAFQIVDDVLDFMGDEGQLGKPVGGDLRQGLVTLPTIYYLEQNPQDTFIRSLLRRGHDGDADIHRAIDLLRDSGAIQAALDEARRFTRCALDALSPLPPGPALQSLRDLAEFVVERQS